MKMILSHYMNMKPELRLDDHVHTNPLRRDFLESLDATEEDRHVMFDTYHLDGALEQALELNE